jgi:hypothetical protein
VRTCLGCGCTDVHACVLDDGRPCSWTFDDLCSACLEPEFRAMHPTGCPEDLWSPLDLAVDVRVSEAFL